MIFLTATRKLWEILPLSSRRRLLWLWAFLTLTSFVEAVGMLCWYPIVVLVSDRGALRKEPVLAALHRWLGFRSDGAFIGAMSLAVILVIVVVTATRLRAKLITARFTWAERTRFGERLLASYLHQPFEWFLVRNSADLAREVTSEVARVVDGCLMTLFRVYSSVVLTAVMLVGVMLIDPWIALVSLAVVGGLFVAVYGSVKERLTSVGRERITRSHAVARGVTEAIAAVKEARMPPWSGDFIETVQRNQERLMELALTEQVLSSVPGQLTEISSKLGILAVALYLVLVDHRQALALVAVYVVAVARIAPKVHAMYRDMARLRLFLPLLDRFHGYLKDVPEVIAGHQERLALVDRVRLEGVGYRYPERDTEVLQDVSLELPRGTSLALVGETGAGKSTLADIFAGLLEPRSGRVLVDGEPLDAERRRRWRNNLGYVPQQVYLTEASVRRNIALGVPEGEVDEAAVRAAAAAASIDEFVLSLPQGYDTILGERGYSISGGQRQRIAIARALYHDPEVVILDEATSALDNLTEGVVLRAVSQLAARKTLVVIAHRLTTVQHCDRICFLAHGRVVASGGYRELLETCPGFAALVEAGGLEETAGADPAPAA